MTIDLNEAIFRIPPGATGMIDWRGDSELTFRCQLRWLEGNMPCHCYGEGPDPTAAVLAAIDSMTAIRKPA